MNEIEADKPLQGYWWFWAFLAMVCGALASQLTDFGKDSWVNPPAEGAMLRLVCQATFPCGLLFDFEARDGNPHMDPDRER